MKKYTITSLFSGCGGLDLGFNGGFKYINQAYKALNFETIFANDIDKNACLTFFKNLKKDIVCADINELLLDNSYFYRKSDMVIGGFSMSRF